MEYKIPQIYIYPIFKQTNDMFRKIASNLYVSTYTCTFLHSSTHFLDLVSYNIITEISDQICLPLKRQKKKIVLGFAPLKHSLNSSVFTGTGSRSKVWLNF